eukprot:scaffold35659_cov21-Prasinocladus_malaysianus.AAC.1
MSDSCHVDILECIFYAHINIHETDIDENSATYNNCRPEWYGRLRRNPSWLNITMPKTYSGLAPCIK